MKVNVYQMVAARDGKSCSFNHIGTVTGENIDRELVWHLTNHSCWNRKENDEGSTIEEEYYPIESDGCTYVPTRFDRGYTNDDICFVLDGRWWVALPIGWKTVDTMEEAKRYLFENADWVRQFVKGKLSFGDIVENF